MSHDEADHHDAELMLRVYDLRREGVMRQSREAILNEEWAATSTAAGQRRFEMFSGRVRRKLGA
jgi:hypothetical protein